MNISAFRLAATLFVYFLTAVAATPASANTYTVGSTRTYHNLNAVAGLLNPGDLVLVDGDQIYPSALLTRSGTQAQPITIRGVRVNGNRPILSGGNNTIEVQSNWTVVESFELTGGSSRCFYHHADQVTLRDSLVRDCPAHGILGADTGSGSFTMEYNEVLTAATAPSSMRSTWRRTKTIIPARFSACSTTGCTTRTAAMP